MPEAGVLERLAAELASGARSAESMADEFLSSITGSPAAFISVDSGKVLGEARASDIRRRDGCLLSRFDGVLLGVKDNIDVVGYKTTNGSRIGRDDPPAAADGAIVASLRKAGLVIAGKTNLSEFAFSGLGLNPHFGTPGRKQSEPRRVPGGSSSGSAVAVADDVVPVALGTDTAGSLRVPPAFNGVYGYRATSTRYSMSGVRPLAPSFDTLGTIARTAADLLVLDSLIESTATCRRQERTASEIVVDRDFLSTCAMTPAVEKAVGLMIEDLRRSGARVVFRRVEQLSRTLDLIRENGWPAGAEAYQQHADLLASPARSEIDPRVVSRLELGAQMDKQVVANTMSRRLPYSREFARQLGDALVLIPTVKHVAPLLEPLELDTATFARVNLETLSLTMIGSFLDVPVVALPAGVDEEGQPISVSIIGSMGEDATVLRNAADIEARLAA